MTDLYWHVATKAQAVIAWLRGDRGAARVLWRWMANRPTPADIEQAKRDLSRPAVQAELARLRSAGDPRCGCDRCEPMERLQAFKPDGTVDLEADFRHTPKNRAPASGGIPE